MIKKVRILTSGMALPMLLKKTGKIIQEQRLNLSLVEGGARADKLVQNLRNSNFEVKNLRNSQKMDK
uniref:Uncharacterized protein n=1 Tax=Romanomermis culicivorax TaxID=13658 RepID=A0A915KJP5_ROMCU